MILCLYLNIVPKYPLVLAFIFLAAIISFDLALTRVSEHNVDKDKSPLTYYE